MVRLPSSLISQPFATLGAILVPVTSQNSSLSAERTRLPFSLSPGPRKPRRQVPPYLPTLRSGFSTIGSCGMRCSTGGSLPALTSSASAGASSNFFGHCAGSVMMVGFSSLPTRPDCDRSGCCAAAAPASSSSGDGNQDRTHDVSSFCCSGDAAERQLRRRGGRRCSVPGELRVAPAVRCGSDPPHAGSADGTRSRAADWPDRRPRRAARRPGRAAPDRASARPPAALRYRDAAAAHRARWSARPRRCARHTSPPPGR